VRAGTTGECVEIHTWLTRIDRSDASTVSIACGWMPFSGSSIASSWGRALAGR